ncbi:small conductance mechanosensitive channel [Orbus hercynius]|uniref:Small-conductance mechanosensitive channel n=1 Tax=Orbus hercynius TaxID=593135 RepID=A0A495REL2_9GAMM|nr:mechanosensitive ion channel domain-containing protein [Orbus hercynius]RKS85922.1 small conductance mechanosensitive channel [Orbus hercynius]
MNVFEKLAQFIEKYDSVVLEYLFHIGFAILIFLLGRFIASFVSKQLRKILLNRDVETTIVKFTSSSARYTIMGFTVVAVLGQLGVQTTSIVAIIGAAGLAIGLALQGSLSNFAAGVLLILFRPFKVGELVVISSIQGTVDAIQIFSTTIITPTGETVTIPNSQVLGTNIINYTRQPNRRIDLNIGVDYSADIKQVYSILQNSVEKTPKILKDLGITIRFNELGGSSINFVVYVWATNEDYSSVRTVLLENIKVDLDSSQINIPYPTMDVNIKKS